MSPSFRPRCRTAIALATGVAALAATGCGSSPPPRVGATSADRLHRTIGDVRASAGAGDRSKAFSALATLSRLVAREAGAGRLSAADAAAMRTGIARARRSAAAEIPVPAPAPVVSAPAPAAPPPAASTRPGKGFKPGKKNKRRGGKGEGDE